jgi:ABC-2 type transport system permease protein
MRIRALVFRILHQLKHDRRTLALMLGAPILVLTLLYFILAESEPVVKVAVINAPAEYAERLDDYNIMAFRYDPDEAKKALEQGEVVATINMISNRVHVEIDASNPSKANLVLSAIEQAKMIAPASRPDLQSEVKYVYGFEDLPMFDTYGAVLIGFMVFFFVFLVAGISFLQERTSGTLERLLSTPIKRWEIVAGYVIGFGLVTVLQSFLISWYCVYVLKIVMIGSFALVLLITLLSAMVALTLGILASTAASNEFQMMQFIPIVIVPQVFFSGLFDLSPSLQVVEMFMPLHYIADALRQVMIKGNGLAAISLDLTVILSCSIVFIILNTVLLKKYRRI